LNCGVGFLYKSALIFVKPEASAIRRDAFSPAIRFAHKLTKKQTRFLQDAIMPDRIRIEAIWPSGLATKFNARLYKNSRLVKKSYKGAGGLLRRGNFLHKDVLMQSCAGKSSSAEPGNIDAEPWLFNDTLIW
jgi:hypothetical protein